MVFFFSGTGNSEYAAKKFANVLGEKTASMADALKSGSFSYGAADDETIGFVFPVYYWGLPLIVQQFVGKIKISGGSGYVWSCITCGGHTGGSGRMLKKALARAGLALSATFGVSMVENYIPMYDTPKNIDQILDDAEKELDFFSEKLLAKETGDFDPLVGGLSRIKTAIAYPLYNVGRNTRRFHADDNCTGCGLCMTLCPAEAIEMKDGRPVWVKDKCAICTACIHRCPEQAVQFGKGTAKRTRYYNPRLKSD